MVAHRQKSLTPTSTKIYIENDYVITQLGKVYLKLLAHYQILVALGERAYKFVAPCPDVERSIEGSSYFQTSMYWSTLIQTFHTNILTTWFYRIIL